MNGVFCNVFEFYEVFNVIEEDVLYFLLEECVKIW